MKKLKFNGKERLSIVIASGTDARKKPKVISIRRGTFVLIIAAAALLAAAVICAALMSVLKAAGAV